MAIVVDEGAVPSHDFTVVQCLRTATKEGRDWRTVSVVDWRSNFVSYSKVWLPGQLANEGRLPNAER